MEWLLILPYIAIGFCVAMMVARWEEIEKFDPDDTVWVFGIIVLWPLVALIYVLGKMAGSFANFCTWLLSTHDKPEG